MRLAASRIAGIAFVLATVGFLTSAGPARAQLRGAAPAPAGAAEPVRALLRVDPPAGREAVDALWQRTIATHTTLLREPGLMRAAVATDEVRKTSWYAQFKGADADANAAAALTKALIVRPVQDTALIEVRLFVEPPADAAVVANAIADKYLEKLADQEQGLIHREVDALSRALNSINLELEEDVVKNVRQKQYELGTVGILPSAKSGGEPTFNPLLLELQEVVRARMAAVKDRDAAKRAVDGAAAPGEAAPKAALKDAEERMDQLAERQTKLQAALGKVNQSVYELRQLDEREAELRRARNAIVERINNLNQIEIGKSHADVHIAARATATP